MGRYSDTNVEKSAILLLKIEQNGGFLEHLSHYIKEWLYFETDFSFKIPLVCSSKWIHESPVYTTLNFWYGTDKIGTRTTFLALGIPI